MKIEGDNVILTKKEYFELWKAELELYLLNSAGVDNWQGCDDAYKGDENGTLREQVAEMKEELGL